MWAQTPIFRQKFKFRKQIILTNMVFVQSKFGQKQPNWIELYTILRIFLQGNIYQLSLVLNRLMVSLGQEKWGEQFAILS